MMHARLLAVVTLILPLSHTYVHDKPLPTFAKCDQNVISVIKQYWKTVGTPRHVLRKIQEGGRYVTLHTSYDYLNTENKCVYMDASDQDKTLTFTFIPKDGSTPGVITYNLKEAEDGSLYDEEKNVRWYTTALSHGIEVNYACSVTGGFKLEPKNLSHGTANFQSAQPFYKKPKIAPLGSIFVAKNRFNHMIQPVISTFRRLLSSMGINFKYNYGPECFGKSSVIPLPLRV